VLARTKGDPVWWQWVMEFCLPKKTVGWVTLLLFLIHVIYHFILFFFTCLQSIDLNGLK